MADHLIAEFDFCQTDLGCWLRKKHWMIFSKPFNSGPVCLWLIGLKDGFKSPLPSPCA
jgi:hypothetical protein